MRFASLVLCLYVPLSAQTGAPSVTGKWVSNLKFFDQDQYQRMELTVDGTKLSGTIGRNHIEGSFRDGKIEKFLFFAAISRVGRT